MLIFLCRSCCQPLNVHIVVRGKLNFLIFSLFECPQFGLSLSGDFTIGTMKFSLLVRFKPGGVATVLKSLPVNQR